MSTVIDSLKAFVTRRSGGALIRSSHVAKHAYIGGGSRFSNSTIGAYSYTGRNGSFFKTEIGRFCSISDHCVCGMPEHDVTRASTSPVFQTGKNRLDTSIGTLPHPRYPQTVIGHDVWIGVNVTIKAGVTIGNGAVIGAGSMVTKDVPPYAIVAGVPAKVLRNRFDEETVARLQQSAWWEHTELLTAEHAALFENPERLLSFLEQEAAHE